MIIQEAHPAAKRSLARVGCRLNRTRCAAERLRRLSTEEEHGDDDDRGDQRDHDPVLDCGGAALALDVQTSGDPRTREARHAEDTQVFHLP